MATGAYSEGNQQQETVATTQPSISTDSGDQDLVRQEAMLKSVDSKGKLKDSSMGIPTEGVEEPDMTGFERVEGEEEVTTGEGGEEKDGRDAEEEVLQEAEDRPRRGLLGSAFAAVAGTATGIKEALATATQEMLGVAGMAGMAPNHEEDEGEEEKEERITDATTDEDHDLDSGSSGNDKAAVQEAQEATEEAFGGGAEGRWLSMHAPPTSAVEVDHQAEQHAAAAPARAERDEEEEEEGGDHVASFDDVPSGDDVTDADRAVGTSRVTPEQQKAADEILGAFRVHAEDPSTAAREERDEEEAEAAYGGDRAGVIGQLDEAEEAPKSSTPKSRTNRLSAKEINGQGIVPNQSQRHGLSANGGGDEEDVVLTTNQEVGGAEGGTAVEQRSREVMEKLREEKGGDKTESPVADEDVVEADTHKEKPVDPVAESLAHLQGLDLVNEGHGSLGAAAVLEHLRAMRESEAAASSAGTSA